MLLLTLVLFMPSRPAPTTTLFVARLCWSGRPRLRNARGFVVFGRRAVDDRRLAFVDAAVTVADILANDAGRRTVVTHGSVSCLSVSGNWQYRDDECGRHGAHQGTKE